MRMLWVRGGRWSESAASYQGQRQPVVLSSVRRRHSEAATSLQLPRTQHTARCLSSHFSSIPLYHCHRRRLLHSILYRQAFIISEHPWDNAVVGSRFGNMKWAPILAHRTQFIWAYFQNSNYACKIPKSSQFFTNFLRTRNKNYFLQNDGQVGWPKDSSYVYPYLGGYNPSIFWF